MNSLAEEFCEVFKLYIEVGDELARSTALDGPQDSQKLVNLILQNRESLERIAQMNSRVMLLSDAWEKCRDHLDPDSREETGKLVEAARAQASRLQELCRIHTEKLRSVCADLGNSLAEIGKGSQFLKSLRPVKNNYPKFVDSLY